MTLLERVNEKLERWYDELERQALERGEERGEARGEARGIELGVTRTRKQLLAEERALLQRMAERRFGAEAAEKVGVVLAETDDNESFASVGDAIVDSKTGPELLRRVTAGR